MYLLYRPNEPVSIIKLLAMDYQKEWVKSNDDRLEEKRLQQKVRVVTVATRSTDLLYNRKKRSYRNRN